MLFDKLFKRNKDTSQAPQAPIQDSSTASGQPSPTTTDDPNSVTEAPIVNQPLTPTQPVVPPTQESGPTVAQQPDATVQPTAPPVEQPVPQIIEPVQPGIAAAPQDPVVAPPAAEENPVASQPAVKPEQPEDDFRDPNSPQKSAL